MDVVRIASVCLIVIMIGFGIVPATVVGAQQVDVLFRADMTMGNRYVVVDILEDSAHVLYQGMEVKVIGPSDVLCCEVGDYVEVYGVTTLGSPWFIVANTPNYYLKIVAHAPNLWLYVNNYLRMIGNDVPRTYDPLYVGHEFSLTVEVQNRCGGCYGGVVGEARDVSLELVFTSNSFSLMTGSLKTQYDLILPDSTIRQSFSLVPNTGGSQTLKVSVEYSNSRRATRFVVQDIILTDVRGNSTSMVQTPTIPIASTIILGTEQTSTETTSIHGVTGGFVLDPLSGALLGIVIIAVVFTYSVVTRKRTRERVSPAAPVPAGIFEVSVSVPSVSKTVTLEVAPDHTVGSLVESVASTLNLPKGRAYAVEYAGKLLSKPDFGESLATLGIKEGSKLSLRVVQ